MNDDKSMDNFMRHLAACEILTKTAMIEYANENLSDERERVKTLALYQDTVQMELLRMISAIHKADGGGKQMINLIDGRSVTPETVARMSNCRLKKTVTALQFLLSVVEEEVGKRIGKGGGGLS